MTPLLFRLALAWLALDIFSLAAFGLAIRFSCVEVADDRTI